jgi:hypothetical protein
MYSSVCVKVDDQSCLNEQREQGKKEEGKNGCWDSFRSQLLRMENDPLTCVTNCLWISRPHEPGLKACQTILHQGRIGHQGQAPIILPPPTSTHMEHSTHQFLLFLVGSATRPQSATANKPFPTSPNPHCVFIACSVPLTAVPAVFFWISVRMNAAFHSANVIRRWNPNQTALYSCTRQP